MIDSKKDICYRRMYAKTSNNSYWLSDGTNVAVGESSKSAAADMLLSLFSLYTSFQMQNHDNVPPAVPRNQHRPFLEATSCHICKEPFLTSDGRVDKVFDHDHTTGEYRGAAHQLCNALYRSSNWMTVVMHNLTGYDMHPLIVALGEISDEIEDVQVIPLSSEKYTTMKIMSRCGACISFIDSMRFLNSSLETLASSLVKNSDLPLLSFAFPDAHHILKGKQFFPYEHLSNYQVLHEPHLPEKTKFFNSLTQKSISDADYSHAQAVWEATHCSSIFDYVKVYLWTDVLLLTEVFETFRDTSLREYNLDPVHFVSMPHMAFDAALACTRVELELMLDIDQILFVRSGIRGGISMITRRKAEANNPLMGDLYDSNTSSDSYIVYADINNLYGFAMSMPLPTGGFAWCDEKEFESIFDDLMAQEEPMDGEEGWIFEVDMTYPQDLHDVHNDLPLAPEKFAIPDADLSSYQVAVSVGKRAAVKKLVPHFKKRDHYVVHFATLHYYVLSGMVVTKIHRILRFKQQPWLKPYIDKNTQLRQNSSSAFEKDMFKLMNNAVYGKTIENVWNRKEVKICRSREQLLKYASKPWFRCFHIVNSDISICTMKKRQVYLNKPLYLGFTVLDLSKLVFYKTFYQGFKKMWPTQMRLLMVDTDSYIMHVTTVKGEGLYNQMYNFICSEEGGQSELRLDCSNYNKDDEDEGLRHLASVHDCDKQLGAVKDEMGSNIITAFVGLRPKLYAIKRLLRPSYTSDEIIKAKGTPRAIANASFNYEHFDNMLTNSICSSSARVFNITSRGHVNKTLVTVRKCLSIADDKRYIDETDHITTFAFGHKDIEHLSIDVDID